MPRVRYYGMFKDLTGKFEETLEGGSLRVRDVINYVIEKYPRAGKVIKEGRYLIILNEKPLSDKELDTEVGEEDVVEILPPASGGCVSS